MSYTVSELARRLEEIEQNGDGDKEVKIDPPNTHVFGVYNRDEHVEIHH